MAKVRRIGTEWGEHKKGKQTAHSSIPHPIVCPLSSCASNFNSTSIFINLLLASEGDRIQTLTRISPQIDLILPHPGDTTKKRRPTFFSPAFPPFYYNLFPISCALALNIMCPSISYPIFRLLLPQFCLLPLLCSSSTSSCFSQCVPPCQSAV